MFRTALNARFSAPWRRWAVLLLLGALSGCGFALRGTTPMPLDTLYVSIPDNTRFGADLRRAITATSPNTRLVATPQEAQAQLLQVANRRQRREVSLNAEGRVEEYELTVRFVFRLVDSRGQVLLPDTTLTASRDMPYDDQVVQAKQGETQTLYQDMEKSLVARVIRRITAPDVAAAIENARAAAARGEPAQIDPSLVPPMDPATPGNDPSWQDPALGSRPDGLF